MSVASVRAGKPAGQFDSVLVMEGSIPSLLTLFRGEK